MVIWIYHSKEYRLFLKKEKKFVFYFWLKDVKHTHIPTHVGCISQELFESVQKSVHLYYYKNWTQVVVSKEHIWTKSSWYIQFICAFYMHQIDQICHREATCTRRSHVFRIYKARYQLQQVLLWHGMQNTQCIFTC